MTALSKPIRLTTETLSAAAKTLAARDRHLASIYRIHGAPPMWARRPGFSTLLRIVLEQQVSLISARAMFERLRSNIEPFTAERFIEFGEPSLRSLGVTRQKAHYCVQVAHAFTNGHLDKIVRMNDEDAHATLLSIKGVGPWTANIYLLMALRRPDIWPDGDVALATAWANFERLTRALRSPSLRRSPKPGVPIVPLPRGCCGSIIWRTETVRKFR